MRNPIPSKIPHHLNIPLQKKKGGEKREMNNLWLAGQYTPISHPSCIHAMQCNANPYPSDMYSERIFHNWKTKKSMSSPKMKKSRDDSLEVRRNISSSRLMITFQSSLERIWSHTSFILHFVTSRHWIVTSHQSIILIFLLVASPNSPCDNE